MRAFLTGLLFVIVVLALAGIGTLLFPLLILLGLLLRVVLMVVLAVLAIWLLGKFILYITQKIRRK